MMPSRPCRVVALVGLWLTLAAGCAVPPAQRARREQRRPCRPPPAPAPAPAPPLAVPPAAFAEVVARAGEQLLREAQAVVGSGPRELVIDPLIDASTGQQTAGTVQIGQQLERADQEPRCRNGACGR